jgi:hypothetical protein
VEIDEFGMVELVHDVNFSPDELLLQGMRYRNELCSKDMATGERIGIRLGSIVCV